MSTAPAQSLVRLISLGAETAVGLARQADPRTGRIVSIDVRLHRRGLDDLYSATGAGLRLSVPSLRHVAEGLLTLADELDSR